ncbi:HAD family hydrolase [Acetomicrobium sp. S15 = DSM 107314]|jgi:putative hydrolase of the HAD superfamily|uniref:HAD family hydrolase n=1 Tax=Acetomicrobium sp. S15 = DSM 107314 TaxID=2529858 RepID=UPI0018E15D12|nr:HAD family phosphatase [Acetomicrobium sp. S15 = DSM 107314]
MGDILKEHLVRAVIFDFGGVIAEEGFVNGLKVIGRRYGKDPDEVLKLGSSLSYETGFVNGKATEQQFWDAFRHYTGISAPDEELREVVLSRFVLRPRVLELARSLKEAGLTTAILSDQTNWLEEINERTPFFYLFDRVFNSYRMGISKRDTAIFNIVLRELGLRPPQAIFVDDRNENVERAASVGIKAILYRDEESLIDELLCFLPQLATFVQEKRT